MRIGNTFNEDGELIKANIDFRNFTAIYVIPAINMTVEDLLGGLHQKETQISVPSMKQYVPPTIKTIKRTKCKTGVLEIILNLGTKKKYSHKVEASSKGNGKKDEEDLLDQFLICTEKEKLNPEHQKWFILDLSVHNETTEVIFSWMESVFSSGTVIFLNQHTIYWDHYSFPLCSIKLIILACPSLLSKNKTNINSQVLPVL